MSILLPLRPWSMLGDVFADYLNVSFPKDVFELVTRDVFPLLDEMGCSEVSPGLFQTEGKGTFKAYTRGKVGIFSASGVFLDCLRRVPGRFREYLGVIASYPHRVSLLHLTADYMVESPPALIQEVKAKGLAGELSLTRKRIQPGQVSALLGVDLRGQETGTVYLGKRQNADVWAKVYDKGHERESRGFPYPGPVARVEIAVQSDVGATLRDVESPESLFFHFASRSIAEGPPGVAEWFPHGEGYVLPPKVDRTALERIESILAGSLDFARVVKLARDEYGDRSWEMTMSAIRRCFANPIL